MPQKTKPKKPKRAPAYSADTMALHLVSGLLLIALGVLLFLAVAARMSGSIFSGMRQLCYGLAGGLAFLLPVFPIWGGILVILSAYRKTRLRTFLLAFVLFLLALTVINLLSRIGSSTLMAYYHEKNIRLGQSPVGFDTYLARSYESSVEYSSFGGVLGMLLAWPLYRMLGSAGLAGALSIIGALIVFVLLIRLDIPGLIARIQGKASEHQQRKQQEQQQLQQQELMWQKRQSELANQEPAPEPYYQEPVYQEQPYQQPVYDAPRYQQAPARKPVDATGRQRAGFRPVKEEYAQPEETYSRQKAAEPAAEGKSRLSRIFGRKNTPEQNQPEQPVSKPQRKGIFQQQVPAEEPFQAEYVPEEQAVYEESVPEEIPQAAEIPAPPVRTTARQSAAADWHEDEQPRRKASWRSEGEEEADYQPRRPAARKQQTAPMKPVRPSRDEIPPWEDIPEEEEVPAAPAVRAPRLQQEPPKDAWKPELKLPPRKSNPQGEQVEMELPPPYVYPGMELLMLPPAQAGISPEEDAMRSQRLEETLQSFRVPAQVKHVTHGPAISRFELELAPGIKVTKVTDLGKNIAMNMDVKSVRIEAPIPGKALVGVEVPNRKVSTVTLREVLESKPMREAKSPLAVALGKDIAGTPIVCDLARMPHLLIAGATGSGKSVCINTMINSLLYRCSPREVRLILVDPKVVELQCYNGIPHLLIPVVSDPHKASGALAWAVAEMMDRYKKFERKGVRAIDGYNAKLEDGEEFMPRIVIIIDELADLMMTCKREVEDHICRLAQLARAAGIHLVVATQRPSVDVITGLIKANIPSRIAFKVSSFVDSRTILDRQGAEQLLGWGDMLYLPTGEFTPIRIQGCYMSDDEVNRVTEFIRDNCEVEYDPNILEQLEQLGREPALPTADEADPTDNINSDASLLAQCIEMAVNDGQVSTSLLQRRLKVGYARAGRLVDEMERRGIVSAKDGAKPRMCLISREEFEQMRESGELED